MKKLGSFALALLATLSSGHAFAACVAATGYSQLSDGQITSLLVGSIACYPAVAPYTNQEYLSGGIITDYKLGASDLIDPSKAIGGYGIAGGTITYSYTGGPAYSYTVWGTSTSGSGSYDFCTGGTPISIRVASGSSGPC